jgi:Leucine-rich repeat (LRR) protein
MQSLKMLILSHNELTFLPETIGLLPQLSLLDVSYNQLTSIPASISFMEKVTCANLLACLMPLCSVNRARFDKKQADRSAKVHCVHCALLLLDG